MFNLFKRKHPKNDLTNPTNLFKSMGPTMFKFWNNFIEGEHYAVELYEHYTQFKNKLNSTYRYIDFDRPVYTVHGNDFSIDLKSGECMYLKLLDLDTDCYLADYDDPSLFVLLTVDDYKKAVLHLSIDETGYCNFLKEYIDKTIYSLVADVSKKRYGFNIFKHTLPYNSLECTNYHRYLAEENYFDSDSKLKKWNRISNSPISSYRNNQSNPIIPISIQYIDVMIVDLLCYATIALPTLDLERVLYYVDDESGKSVINSLIARYGEGIDIFIDRIITEMNCAPFHNYVRSGLKLK